MTAVDTTLTDAMLGVVLDGRYRIDDRLADGGMSTVYAGTDLRLERTVAVKVMSPSLAGNPVFVDRFSREARAAARLSHINVVSVFDQGTDRGHAFLVMELVRGHTLRDLLAERGRLTPAEAVAVLEPVLAGLTAAHRTGLVHRDIKPENVLISDEGVVKVADFGLARAVAAGSAATRSGDVLIGTVAYLSPEQIQSGAASPRSDVYAAGILLYEMLTGRPPYSGETAISIAYRHVNSDVPPPSAIVPTIPPRLSELTVEATRREPSGRPLDAGVFLAELWDARTDVGLERVPVPTRSARAARTAPAGAIRTTLQQTTHHTGSTATGARMKRATQPVPAPRTRRRRSGLIAFALVLVLALVAGTAGWWFGSGRYTEVPALVELSEDDAVAVAQDVGIDLIFTETVFSETVPGGQVISTEPGDGARVVRGTEVVVTVSRGTERFKVSEELIGRPLQEVLDALDGTPVGITQTEEYDDTVPAGSVAAFDPPADTELRRDDPLTIVVSRGPAPVEVPDVSGLQRLDAVTVLRDGNLNVSTVEEFSNDVEVGLVIGQDPTPDVDPVMRGTTVTIVVSKGPDLVAVPDVRGLPLSQATATLEGAGFVVDGTCFLCSDGTVALQDPDAEELALRGSTISLLATF